MTYKVHYLVLFCQKIAFVCHLWNPCQIWSHQTWKADADPSSSLWFLKPPGICTPYSHSLKFLSRLVHLEITLHSFKIQSMSPPLLIFPGSHHSSLSFPSFPSPHKKQSWAYLPLHFYSGTYQIMTVYMSVFLTTLYVPVC